MADRLNVLLIVLDCARADHLSCYGYERETMPFVDQVAREGVRFTNTIATEPLTLPAHASLFTGLYSATHGATDEHRFLSARHKLISEHLKAAGYRTAGFSTHPLVSPETGFGRGFDAFFTQRHHNRLAARALLLGRRASDRLLRRKDSGARRTTQALKKWLAARDEPFFAFVHYKESHLPYLPPPPFDRIFMPKGIANAPGLNQDYHRYIAGQVEMGEGDLTQLTALYDGALRYIDYRLREVADFLRARGVWDRTLCIITADHGEHLGDHGMMGHKFGLHDTVLRVPLVLRCPPCVPQGFVVEELAQTVDLLPTVLNLVGVSDDAGALPGRPLLDQGRATAGPAFAIAERFRPNLSAFQKYFPAFEVRPFDVRQKAIRTKREKFVWHSDEANELYDLHLDPGETHNLIDRDPERADNLRRQLFDWLASVEQFQLSEQAPALDDLMREQLQGLGYID